MDFVSRFFRLTLDNVYRFTCSLVFVIAVVAVSQQLRPTDQFIRLLDWAEIPSTWLQPAAEWIGLRQDAVAFVSALLLIVAVGFTTANDWQNRSGSTALISAGLLMEVGKTGWLLAGAVVIIVISVVVTGATAYVSHRMRGGQPDWVGAAWDKVGRAASSLIISAVYVLSPLGWLISQDSPITRGSRSNPLYIESVASPGPSGARLAHGARPPKPRTGGG